MVAALILVGGLLWCIAIVYDYIHRPTTSSMLADMEAYDEARSADFKKWASEPETTTWVRDVIHKAASRERDRAEKQRLERQKTTREKATVGVVGDVTDALVAMGWPRSDCRILARNAVRALGPKASLEDLTKYALSNPVTDR